MSRPGADDGTDRSTSGAASAAADRTADRRPGDNDAPLAKPWIALVQEGILQAVFPGEEAEAADRATTRLALSGGQHVWVYEIAAHGPPPPALGTRVEPERLGWIHVG